MLTLFFITTLDERIDGYAFKNLDDSALREFGLSYGFRHTLLDIIENLVCDVIQLHSWLYSTRALN